MISNYIEKELVRLRQVAGPSEERSADVEELNQIFRWAVGQFGEQGQSHLGRGNGLRVEGSSALGN